MYNVVVDYVWSHIEPQLNIDMLVRISNVLKYMPDGIKYTWAFKHHKIDGYTYLFDTNMQRFRTGLLWRVCRELLSAGINFNICDIRKKRRPIKELIACFGNIRPYEFQISAVDTTNNTSHGVIVSPTGSGKTIIIALLIDKHKLKTLIVVDNRVLLYQTYDFLNLVFPNQVGIIGDGDFSIRNVTVATVQSLTSILGIGKKQEPTAYAQSLQEYLLNVGLVVHDEVQGADNKGINILYTKIPANIFIGTTATPYAWARVSEKDKNLEMEQNFGTKIYDSREIVDFIKLGITVPLYIQKFSVPVVPNFGGRTSGNKEDDYKEILDAQVINNKARTLLIAQKARELVKAGCSCYVYFKFIKHGEELYECLSDMNPMMMQGKTPRNKRDKILQQINDKERLLVISDIGSYGLNIRSLDSVILAHPLRDLRQIKGRACRAYPGKKFGLILDPVDEVPILLKHSELRHAQAKADGDLIVGW